MKVPPPHAALTGLPGAAAEDYHVVAMKKCHLNCNVNLSPQRDVELNRTNPIWKPAAALF
jgi:hypothetical protein